VIWARDGRGFLIEFLERRTPMLPLVVGMGLPLFAVIAYALLSSSAAGAEGTHRDMRS
jgi:hypothetical protein